MCLNKIHIHTFSQSLPFSLSLYIHMWICIYICVCACVYVYTCIYIFFTSPFSSSPTTTIMNLLLYSKPFYVCSYLYHWSCCSLFLTPVLVWTENFLWPSKHQCPDFYCHAPWWSDPWLCSQSTVYLLSREICTDEYVKFFFLMPILSPFLINFFLEMCPFNFNFKNIFGWVCHIIYTVVIVCFHFTNILEHQLFVLYIHYVPWGQDYIFPF